MTNSFRYSDMTVGKVAAAILSNLGLELDSPEKTGWEKKVIKNEYFGRTDIPESGTSVSEVTYTKGHYLLRVYDFSGSVMSFNEFKMLLMKGEEVLFNLHSNWDNDTIEGSHSFVSQALYTERVLARKFQAEDKAKEERKSEENRKNSKKIHQLQEIIKNGGLGKSKAEAELRKLTW